MSNENPRNRFGRKWRYIWMKNFQIWLKYNPTAQEVQWTSIRINKRKIEPVAHPNRILKDHR